MITVSTAADMYGFLSAENTEGLFFLVIVITAAAPFPLKFREQASRL